MIEARLPSRRRPFLDGAGACGALARCDRQFSKIATVFSMNGAVFDFANDLYAVGFFNVNY
jgi:hypothetical protein